MRPYSSGGRVSAMVSPTWAPGLARCASASEIWFEEFSTMLDHQHVARQPQLALLGVDLGVNVGLAAVTGAGRLGDGVFHRGDHDAAVDRLFAGDRVCDLQQFEFVGTDGHGLVSFGRIEVAPAQSFCGEAVFLGIGRLRLLAGLACRAWASACCSWPDRSSSRAAAAAAPARDSASIRARPACRAASIPQSVRRSKPAVHRRCLPSPAARRHLRPRVCHPDVAARHRLRRRRGARGNACGPDGRPPFRS